MTTVNKLVNQLQEARRAYYESDSPLMSDDEFDALEDILRKTEPHHDYFTRVGFIESKADENGKITHRIPMLSLAKAKTLQEVEKWLNKLSPQSSWELVVQPKIDGLSATLGYNHGRLNYVASRGDGKQGQIISHIADYIEDIPKSIDFTTDKVEIRGELHLPKNTEYHCGNRPLRNICVGLINRKDRQEDLKYVRFLAYQILWTKNSMPGTAAKYSEKEERRFNSEAGKIDILAESGFYTFEKWLLTPPNSIGELLPAESTPDEITKDLILQLSHIYKKYILELRDKWNYETDGLVIMIDNSSLHDSIDERWVVSHHHHYALAFKPPSQKGKTPLHTITWQVSRQGNLTPVAIFAPIRLSGAVIERASLHNAANVRRLRLSPGDLIQVERANDVIPYVCANPDGLERHEDFVNPDLWPITCPTCGTPIEESGVNITCTNTDCRDRRLQSILFWVRQTGMKHIALRTLETLYDRGKIKMIGDMYKLRKEDFHDLEGFGEKKIANFLVQAKRVNSMAPVEFIGRLGVPMVQEKSLARIGIESIDDFMKFNDESSAIGKNIVDWKRNPDNMKLVKELLEVVTLEKQSAQKVLKGIICLTGKAPIPRKSLIAILKSEGWRIVDSVTGDTGKVICDKPSKNSAKIKKAREAGVDIVTYEDFLDGEGINVAGSSHSPTSKNQ